MRVERRAREKEGEKVIKKTKADSERALMSGEEGRERQTTKRKIEERATQRERVRVRVRSERGKGLKYGERKLLRERG